MTVHNTLSARLGLTHPVLQAGMGGVAGQALAAAVAAAGAGGQIGLYKMPPAAVEAALRGVRRLTDAVFGANVIAEVAGADLLDEQVEVIAGCGDTAIFVSAYGPLPDDVMYRLGGAGIPVVVQVGDLVAAEEAMAKGATAVMLQGTDAGGHLLGRSTSGEILELLASGAAAAMPVLVSGGVADADDVDRCLEAGAVGVLCGTCFVVAEESNAHPSFKDAVCGARAEDTEITTLFEVGWPGRRHRVLRNSTVASGGRLPSTFLGRTTVAGAPALVPRYSASVPTVQTSGDVEAMAMYAGTSCAGVERRATAAEIVRHLTC